MTIAVCCLSLEGAVLGADSALSANPANGFHFLNHNQKLFELGNGGTLGVLTWGLGGLPRSSYRRLLGLLSDEFEKNAPASVSVAAKKWTERFWAEYSTDLKNEIQRCKDLDGKSPRDKAEEDEFQLLRRGLVVGFCLAGHVKSDRKTEAYEIVFDPLKGKPVPIQQLEFVKFWGAPNPISRLLNGADMSLKDEIVKTGKWSGSDAELNMIFAKQALKVPQLPLRDAIDLVHTCIHSTIKAMKFSDLTQICGGPIEIAAITSDRQFRWVKHKALDAAINEGMYI
jgi:hypothetical protein